MHRLLDSTLLEGVHSTLNVHRSKPALKSDVLVVKSIRSASNFDCRVTHRLLPRSVKKKSQACETGKPTNYRKDKIAWKIFHVIWQRRALFWVSLWCIWLEQWKEELFGFYNSGILLFILYVRRNVKRNGECEGTNLGQRQCRPSEVNGPFSEPVEVCWNIRTNACKVPGNVVVPRSTTRIRGGALCSWQTSTYNILGSVQVSGKRVHTTLIFPCIYSLVYIFPQKHRKFT